MNIYIAKVHVENFQKFCCTHVKFLQFPTSKRLVIIYMSTQIDSFKKNIIKIQ